MSVAELIAKSYLLATGKPANLLSTDRKYQRLLGIANIFQDMWQGEPDIEWNSTYRSLDIGTVSSSATYDIPEEVRYVSKREGDSVLIRHLNSTQVSEYKFINPDEAINRQWHNAVSTIEGQLVFSRAFTVNDPQFGGTIYLPCYVRLEPLAAGSDDILVDSPNWLVLMTAAEYVRNDTLKQNQYGNFIALAQNEMQKMKQNNVGQDETIDMYPAAAGETWGDSSHWREW